jgi:hypothetical protein
VLVVAWACLCSLAHLNINKETGIHSLNSSFIINTFRINRTDSESSENIPVGQPVAGQNPSAAAQGRPAPT